MSKPTFVMVDGSSYLFRAFHALPPLTNSKQMPTGAVYGVLNMLRKLLADYEPEHLAVVFDAKGKTFRDDMYPEYKANRPPMPDDLRVQIEPLHKIIKAMGLPLIVIEGVEADDVIGTLAVQAKAKGFNTIISTGDKDMAQLVNDQVTLINTMNNSTMDIDGVETKFGVKPEGIIDYLALIGDKVDNVPGVPKVGPKTAVKWLGEYGDLETIMAKADDFKGKVGENLRGALEQLPLSKELVTIKCDVALDFSLDDLKAETPDREQLIELYRDMEFKRWLSEQLDGEEAPAAASIESNYEVVLTESDFKAWLKKLSTADLIAVDTETDQLDYMAANVVGISFCIEAGHACYIPFGHDYDNAPSQLSRDYVLRELKALLENPNIHKVGQHIKYDINVLANHGIHLQGVAFDTMLESYVLNSTAVRHNMDAMSLKYLGRNTIKYEEVAGKGVKQKSFNEIELDVAGPYAAEDADITLQLHQALWPQLEQEPSLAKVLQEIEVPLIPVLSNIERHGVLLDDKMLATQSADLAARLDEIQNDAFDLAGKEFNLSSPKQLQGILFEELGLPVIEKTPKGAPSTAEGVLQELALDYPLPKLILEHRSLSKLKSTYTDKLPELMHKGRVHTSYHQAVAATGRLSSSDPNLQNIPVRTAEGRKIRQAFVAPKDHKIVAADYSQIELRIMAHLCGDQSLLDAFAKGLDIHTATAAEVFGSALDKVTKEQRRRAKAINFGLIYGMSAFGLAKQLGISRNDAQDYVDTYFERYPGVHEYMERTREQAHYNGYVETIFGRRLYLPEINARNIQRQKAAERAAINAPMQGSAADIIKRAMLDVDTWLQQSKLGATMIMQVHDELVFEVNSKDLDAVNAGIKAAMENAADLKVKLEVEIGIGDNWDEAH